VTSPMVFGCANPHAKLIDDDELTYTPAILHDWKETAEHMAALEARGYAAVKAKPFENIERKMPTLFQKCELILAYSRQ